MMRSLGLAASVLALAAWAWAAGAANAGAKAPNPDVWRQLNVEDTLYIDTSRGRIVVEMYPDVAAKNVARIKQLAHEHFYDGLTFHRVIDKMMAQGGDPKGTGEGGSKYPDLPGEFRFRRSADMPFLIAASPGGALSGFYKALPISSQPNDVMSITRDHKADAWALHCPGIASMARAESDDSANSQFFLMRAAYPSLDKRYTIWGRVVWGEDIVQSLAAGDPPSNPDKMIQVRVASELPASERAPLYVMRTDSKDFRDIVEETRKKRRADFSVCDIDVPARVADQESKSPKEKERAWWHKIPLIP